MKIEVTSEKENPLRKRKEYWLMADHGGKETPSRHDLLPEVAKALKSKEDLTVIDKIFSERGIAKSRVKVMIYGDKKEVPKEKLERQERKVKKFLEKKQAAAAAPAAEPAGAPAEGEAESAPEQKEDESPAEEAPAEEEQPKPAESSPEQEEEVKHEAEDDSEEKKEGEPPAEEPDEEPSEDKSDEKEKKEEGP